MPYDIYGHWNGSSNGSGANPLFFSSVLGSSSRTSGLSLEEKPCYPSLPQATESPPSTPYDSHSETGSDTDHGYVLPPMMENLSLIQRPPRSKNWLPQDTIYMTPRSNMCATIENTAGPILRSSLPSNTSSHPENISSTGELPLKWFQDLWQHINQHWMVHPPNILAQKLWDLGTDDYRNSLPVASTIKLLPSCYSHWSMLNYPKDQLMQVATFLRQFDYALRGIAIDRVPTYWANRIQDSEAPFGVYNHSPGPYLMHKSINISGNAGSLFHADILTGRDLLQCAWSIFFYIDPSTSSLARYGGQHSDLDLCRPAKTLEQLAAIHALLMQADDRMCRTENLQGTLELRSFLWRVFGGEFSTPSDRPVKTLDPITEMKYHLLNDIFRLVEGWSKKQATLRARFKSRNVTFAPYKQVRYIDDPDYSAYKRNNTHYPSWSGRHHNELDDEEPPNTPFPTNPVEDTSEGSSDQAFYLPPSGGNRLSFHGDIHTVQQRPILPASEVDPSVFSEASRQELVPAISQSVNTKTQETTLEECTNPIGGRATIHPPLPLYDNLGGTSRPGCQSKKELRKGKKPTKQGPTKRGQLH